jgi:hypothetical protein
MKLSDLRCFRLRVFVVGQSNVLYMPKNQLLGVEMESLQLVSCLWFIGLIGLDIELPKINVDLDKHAS